MRALARSIVESLRSQPLALALVIVNVLYLLAGAYIWRASHTSRVDLVNKLMENCVSPAPK